LKAVREAKVNSGWLRPDEGYEAALQHFVRASLDPSSSRPFLDDVDAFVARLGRFGILNSLAGTALRLTVPGVPDLYQGDELLNFNLVDPDNRRGVDFRGRDTALSALEAQQRGSGTFGSAFASLLDEPADGQAKLYLIWRLLQLRRQLPELFADGDYLPLAVGGERSEHVCAFARRRGDTFVIVVAGRWFARLQEGGDGFLPEAGQWRDTRVALPPGCGRLRDVLGETLVDGASGELPAADLLAPQPVAVLASSAEDP
jgi:(1->4)-alpha-D-glucan 1-alpha-D-glucosylmutase